MSDIPMIRLNDHATAIVSEAQDCSEPGKSQADEPAAIRRGIDVSGCDGSVRWEDVDV